MLNVLALSVAPAPSISVAYQGDPTASWAPVVLLIVIGVLFAVGTVVLSTLVGPSQTGPGKETAYESGMVPVGDTRQRFNVRFYIVAMIFLVFDVEIVIFYPWATIFPWAAQTPGGNAGLLLAEMVVFVVVLLVAYAYAWGKGVFRWD